MPIFSSRSQAALVLALLSTPFITLYFYRRSKLYYSTHPTQRYFYHPPLPPPTVPTTSPNPTSHSLLTSSHLITRLLYHILPIPLHHAARDAGLLRVSDVLAVVLAPLMFVVPWRMRLLWECAVPSAWPVRVGYGVVRGLKEMKVEVHNRHWRERRDSGGSGGVLSPIAVFTHGGAWGSGKALMYRLRSSCFDRQLHCVTFTPNYHVYPTADVIQQVEQLMQLLTWLANEGERYGGDISKVLLVGHSSGAHLTLLHLLTVPSPPSAPTTSSTSTPTITSIAISSPTPSSSTTSTSSTQPFSPFAPAPAQREVRVIGAIGLSGVYDIASHYLFESRRGVHEFSPMKPACHDIPNFPQHSPTLLAQERHTQQQSHSNHQPTLPPVLLVHGDSDQTVPDLESRRLCEALGGRVRRLEVSVEGRRMAEVEAWEKEVGSGSGACECVIYADGDHGSTVLSLMTRTGTHLMDTLRTFIQRCADGSAAVDGQQRETAVSLHLAELQLVSRL